MTNCPVEISFRSARPYKDPFNEVKLDAIITAPDGRQRVIPAFWSGNKTWKIRYSSPLPGWHHYQTVCSDAHNKCLHNQTGRISITRYQGQNPLWQHGPLKISPTQTYLEHIDGTPFFWLGDTWWMSLCKRLRWPDEFKLLTTDRVKKGFTVIQIVAGLYPDMPPFDPRGANEAGYPWTKKYTRINPAYFDKADRRIQHLVNSGLVPCIVACWGYFLRWTGVAKMKQHWRNLIARYGAYPVVWCLAGEAIMPYYLSKNHQRDTALQKKGWTKLAEHVRHTDPYHHPITIHPTTRAYDQVEKPSLIDIEMLQTGHLGYYSIPNAVAEVNRAVKRRPRKPVLIGEACYEGILDASRPEVQRFVFWSSLLSGTAGHTYGANGLWQLNTRKKPFGPSPHGGSWGNTPWPDAYRLPGSTQIGLGKRLLKKYEWWRFEPHPDWAKPQPIKKDRYHGTFCAGIPRKIRICYFPFKWSPVFIRKLEPGISYRAFLFDPITGRRYPLGKAASDKKGRWFMPTLPIAQDWVVVLEH